MHRRTRSRRRARSAGGWPTAPPRFLSSAARRLALRAAISARPPAPIRSSRRSRAPLSRRRRGPADASWRRVSHLVGHQRNKFARSAWRAEMPPSSRRWRWRRAVLRRLLAAPPRPRQRSVVVAPSLVERGRSISCLCRHAAPAGVVVSGGGQVASTLRTARGRRPAVTLVPVVSDARRALRRAPAAGRQGVGAQHGATACHVSWDAPTARVAGTRRRLVPRPANGARRRQEGAVRAMTSCAARRGSVS